MGERTRSAVTAAQAVEVNTERIDMEDGTFDQAKQTPKGLMNIWVGEQIRSIENMIDSARSSGATDNTNFLRGTLTGIRMLQMRWLDGDFDSDAV